MEGLSGCWDHNQSARVGEGALSSCTRGITSPAGFSCPAQIRSEPGPDGLFCLRAPSLWLLPLGLRGGPLPGEQSSWGQAEWSAVGRVQVQHTVVWAPGSTDRKWPGPLEVIKPLIGYQRDRTHFSSSHHHFCVDVLFSFSSKLFSVCNFSVFAAGGHICLIWLLMMAAAKLLNA